MWLRDVSAVTVLTPTPDLMSVDWRAQGQKATQLPHNLLSRFTDNIKRSDLLFKRLKSCCKRQREAAELMKGSLVMMFEY